MLKIALIFTTKTKIREEVMKKSTIFSSGKILIVLATFMAATSSAMATTIWTDWTDISLGDPGSANGSLGSTLVSYSGEATGNSNIAGTSTIWNPETTYVGGVVDTSPDSVGDHIALDGSSNTGTINFSAPIVDPVIAIWSLGRPGSSASFTFQQTPTFVVGGPNSQFGGSAIVVDGNLVSGNEGNGVILFSGEFSSISFTSTNESWYAFTVGANGEPAVIPIPAAAWLFGSGLLGLLGLARRNVSS
jgi:hypothetical protein